MTRTETGVDPGFTTRIGIVPVAPGPSDAGSDGTETAIGRRFPTGPGAHSVAVSEANGRVYVPIAVEAGPLKGGCGCIAVYGTE